MPTESRVPERPDAAGSDARDGEFRWPVRVYHEDTDAGGIVYHANYLRYMERARTEWLRGLGCEQDALKAEHGLMFVLVALSIEYRAPAVYNDLLEVGVKILECGRASIRLAQPVYRGSATLVCRGETRIACVDAGTLRPRPFPAPIYSELTGDR